MCFYTKSNEIKIAEEDIIVHKLFFDTNDDEEKEKDHVFSIVQRAMFKIGELNDEVIIIPKPIDKSETSFIINEGYHSYEPGNEVTNWHWHSMYKCIIPKGSKYMKASPEYVSSNIIVIEKIKENEND